MDVVVIVVVVVVIVRGTAPGSSPIGETTLSDGDRQSV